MKNIFFVAILFAAISCVSSSKDDHAKDEPKAEAAHDHAAGAICPSEAAKAGVVAGVAESKEFRSVIPAIGEVLPMQGESLTITAKNDGVVVFNKQLLPGVKVSNSETLLVVSSQGITQGGYGEVVDQADIALSVAKQQYDRNKALFEDKLVTATELDRSFAEAESAKLKMNNLRQNFINNGLKVASPMAGFVTDVLVSEGDFVRTGDALMIISNDNRLTLRAEVSPDYISQLSKVSSANFRTSASREFLSVEELGGKVASVGRSVSASSLLVPVYFTIPYRSGLTQGAFAEVNLLLNEGNKNVVVPVGAIIEELSTYYVYALDAHGYERREVKIGSTNGIEVEILSGLRSGEKIAVKGAIRLKLIENLSSGSGEAAAHAGHSH